jgi:hypothetical protein
MNTQHTYSYTHTAARLTAALEALDELHNAAGEGTVELVNPRGQAELVAMLHEIAYVAAETAQELGTATAEPTFRLIKGHQMGRTATADKYAPDGDRSRGSLSLRVLGTHPTPDFPFYVVRQAGG